MPRRRWALIPTALLTVATLCAPGTAGATEDAKWSDPVMLDENRKLAKRHVAERQDDGRMVAVWRRENRPRGYSV